MDKFYFSDCFLNNKSEFKRKYYNNWYELREYTGFNAMELNNNELIICNSNYTKPFKLSVQNYNILTLVCRSTFGGISYSH